MKDRFAAAVELLLILPAALFMAAVFLQGAFEHPQRAEALVRWYTTQTWTLGLLLFGLPAAVFFSGIALLMRDESRAVLRAHLATFVLTATTLGAAAVLAVVVLHMAAN